jgi:tRNA threonylcarbamoyl adenosine modification protein YjeE
MGRKAKCIYDSIYHCYSAMMEKLFQVHTPADFLSIIELIFKQADHQVPLVIALTGDLGAGKTAFTQELGKFLGVSEPIVSPTYTLMKQYSLNHDFYQELVHIDAYRIESEDEIGPLHLETVLNKPKTIICIEWPEMISAVIPKGAINLSINIIEGENREVGISRLD